jgi:hypothetical protein
VAAPDGAVVLQPQPHQNIAPEPLDDAQPLPSGGRDRRQDRAVGNAGEKLVDQPQALLDLAHADPDPGVDIGVLAHRHLESQRVVGRVGKCPAGVERTAGGAPDKTAGGEPAHEAGRAMPVPTVRSCRDGTPS